MEMVTKAGTGELVDCGKGPFGHVEMQAWEEERTVRAAVLRHLLVAEKWPVDARGVQLRGVRISGHLDLTGASVRCPLVLEWCYLDADKPVCLDCAIASRVALIRCQLAGLTGDTLTAKELNLVGSTLTGTLRLRGADIAGEFICSGAKLFGRNKDGEALFADGLKTGGRVVLDGILTKAGVVRLRGADIGSQFSCRGARLNGTDDHGRALVADGLKTGDPVFLDGKFTTAGTVLLASVHVSGSMYLSPAALAGAGKVALMAVGAKIDGTLRWAPDGQVSGRVNLESAQVGELEDNWTGERANANGYWPADGRLRLNGFTYGRFSGNEQATVKQRLAWLRSQYGPKPTVPRADTLSLPVFAPGGNEGTSFTPQPYEQLARVYRQAGQDTEARTVAIARRIDLRKYGDLNPYRKVGNWLLDKTIKYGYQTWRAGVALALLYLAVWLLAIFAAHHHGIVPLGDVKGLDPAPSATVCTAHYPCFFPAGYAVDVVVPIINVHQAQYWGPNGHVAWGTAWVTVTWMATVLGWALATLLVAGLTGLTRRGD